MDTRTGKIFTAEEMAEAIKAGPPRSAVYFAPIKRDLTAKELMQKQIRLYSPCGCGSGKKFKFCCKTNQSK